MKGSLNFRVDVDSTQKLTALREKLAAELADDPDVSLIDTNSACDTQTFRVIGVDTSTKEPFNVTVEATDKDDATAQVVGSSKTKIVAEVR